jgi:hypothetical protein
MLDIQRRKFEIRDRLREAGLSDLEIEQHLTEELNPFTPAFIDGKRVNKELPPLELKPLKKSRRSRGHF